MPLKNGEWKTGSGEFGGAVSENFGIVEGLSAKFSSHVGCTRGSEARGKT